MPQEKARYLLNFETKTAIHVGTLKRADDVSDSMFRGDSKGNLIIPGTGIAGAIRNHLTRLAPALTKLQAQGRKIVCDALSGEREDPKNPKACGCIVCHLTGDIRPRNEILTNGTSLEELEQKNGRASRLIVHDAVLSSVKESKIRDAVGIDRTTGTSARAAFAKFDLETVPAGATFDLHLELEDPEDVDEYLLDVIFHEWQAGRLKIGAGKSRGLGTLELTGAHEHHVHLSTSDGLAAYLKRHSAPLGWQPKTIPVPDRRYHDEYQRQDGAIQSWITFEFDLEIQGFFLTDDTTTAVMAGVDACSLNFLPGASLRGVIRSQAERIARTLANLKANSEEEFLERCAASDPFATRAGKGIQSSAARIRASENYNELRTDENNFDLAEQLFGSVEWGSRLSVEDAPKLSDAGRKKLDFVAIDRFTGGAAEGAKFDAEALWKPVFKCKLHLESPEAWEIGWLLYTLRDLADGRVTVGAGGRKGFGRTSIGQLTVTLGYTYPKAAPFSGVSETGDGFYIEAPTTIENLKEVPTELLQPYDDKIAEYRVAVAHTNSVDPYWGTSAKDLYRKETSLDDILKSS